jgi:hypothetical protein
VRKIIQGAIAAGLVAAVSVVPSAGAGNTTLKNKYSSNETVTRDCDGGKIIYVGPLQMWPPNHKYATGTITAVATEPTDNVTLNSTGTNNQYEGDTEASGTGHTADDIVLKTQDGTVQSGQSNVTVESSGTGSVIHTVLLRSERAGSIQDGRVYTLTETATFGDDEPCTPAPFQVAVPHDMRNKP